MEIYNYWNLIRQDFESALQGIDLDLRKDDSDYHVVDGEEGDYGQIRYYDNNELVYTYINNGGDDEDYEFTEYGKSLMEEHILIVIENQLLLRKIRSPKTREAGDKFFSVEGVDLSSFKP